jgi:recombination protein RecR
LKVVVEQLAQLPGLGPKSALRAALHVLKEPRVKAELLGRSILDLREKLCFCSRCKSLSDADPCPLCTDPRRRDDELMLVAEWDSLLALEEGAFFNGRYFVLGGLIAPLDDVAPSDLELDALKARLAEGEVTELILALGTTLDAESTAQHVKDMAARHAPNVKVSRLAQGIPLGAQVKFMDKETLRRSLEHRQDV